MLQALVHNITDGEKYLTSVDKIQNFDIKNVGLPVVYDVCDEVGEDETEPVYMKAMVLAVGDSKEDVEELMKSLRILRSKNTTGGEENDWKLKEIETRNVSKKQGMKNRKRRIRDFSEDDDDVEYKTQCILLKKENRKLEEEVNILKKKCQINEDVRATEKSLLENVQSLNYRLQTQLLNLLEHDKGKSPVPSVSSDESIIEYNSEDLPQIPDDGDENISLTEDQLSHVNSQRSDSLYVKALSVALFGASVLAECSVTGTKSNRSKDRPPRPALSIAKVQYIKDSLRKRLIEQRYSTGEINLRVNKVNHYISEKIADVRRKIKN